MSETQPLGEVRPYSLAKGGWYEWSDERAAHADYGLPESVGKIFRDTFSQVVLFDYDPGSLHGNLGHERYFSSSYMVFPSERADEHGFVRLTPTDRPAPPVARFLSEWHRMPDSRGYSEGYFAECRRKWVNEDGLIETGMLQEVKAERDLLESEIKRAGDRIAVYSRPVERILKVWLCESIVVGKGYARGLAGGIWQSFAAGHDFQDELRGGAFTLERMHERLIEDGSIDELSDRTFDGLCHYIQLRDTVLEYAERLDLRRWVIEWILFSWYRDQSIPHEAPEFARKDIEKITPESGDGDPPDEIQVAAHEPRVATKERVVLADRIIRKSLVGELPRLKGRDHLSSLLSSLLRYAGTDVKDPLKAVLDAVGYDRGRGQGDFEYAKDLISSSVEEIESDLGEIAVRNQDRLVENWIESLNKTA